MRRTFLLCLLGLLLACRGDAVAADFKPPRLIRLKVIPIAGLGRSQAPQTYEIWIESTSSKVYEGRLELKTYIGTRLVNDYLSQELVVGDGGGLRLRMMLPPLVRHSAKTNMPTYARFLTEREAIDLGEVDLATPAIAKRTFVIANVQPQELLRAQYVRGIPENVGLEQFSPQADTHLDLLTYTARLTPEEMPLLAIAYTAYDLLVLENEGFQKLRRGQLAAIADWVAGGGSVVVAPTGELTAYHVEFLNRLSRSTASGGGASRERAARHTVDDRGRLVIDAEAPVTGKKLSQFVVGLGRAVIVHERLDPDDDFATPEWREAVAFLWKLRKPQLESIGQGGAWSYSYPTERNPWALPAFAPQEDHLAGSIREFLMPEKIEGVPLPVVVVILSLFLLAVAPGDYFLLGRLNCRKYTWWLFVLVSATFTFCTVKTAEYFMGHTDYQTSLVFVDVDQRPGDSSPQAAIVRSNRFEMLFVSVQQKIEKTLRNCLYSDVTDSATAPKNTQFASSSFGQSVAETQDLNAPAATDLALYEGTFPAAYAVHQQLRQWSPRVARQTSFTDDPALLAETTIDWNKLSVAGANSPKGREALFAKVLESEPNAQIVLVHDRWAYDPAHNDDRPASALTEGVNVPLMSTAFGPRIEKLAYVPASAHVSPAGQLATGVAALALRASVRPTTGLFAVLSQISPTGGEILEDLSILDETDPSQWLLIVAVRRETTWIVYRKLCCDNPSSGGAQ